ncbi:MAG: flippase [Candidatus Shapirobacteria bacterium]|jgi:O-antigen/teichoic acid export membrane protein
MINKLKELFFTAESTRKIVFKNFLWLAFSQVGSRIIRASITLYAARTLGASQYGVFSYAIGLAGFFIFFKNIGIDSIMTRDIAKNPHLREKIFSTGFWIEIVLLVFTVLLLLFIAPFFSKINEAVVLLPVIAVMLVADDLRDFFFAFFRGVEKMEWEAIIVTLVNVLVTVFGFVALAYVNTPLSLASAYASASVLATIIAGSVVFWRYGLDVIRKFSKDHIIPVLSAAWPIAMAGLPSVFLFSVDLVMLGWWWPASEVGIYAATQKIIGILMVVPQLIATSTFPVLARLIKEQSKEKIKALMESILKMILAFSVPIFIGGMLLGGELLSRIFGVEYASGNVAFTILLGSIFAVFPLMIFSNFVFANNAQRQTVSYPFISSGINIILNFLLVPNYGMVGASFATLISFGIYAFLMYRFSKKIEYFSIFKKPAKICISTALMAVLIVFLNILGMDVILNVGISALVYIGLLIFLKEDIVLEAVGLFKK